MTDKISASLPPILLVGGGKMGAAMLAGWLQAGLQSCVVIDPAPQAAALAGPKVRVFADPADIPADFAPAALVLAVKPQMAAQLVPAYAGWAANSVTLSIMAGRSIAGLRALLGDVAVVRAMPNTPAAIRQGISAACAGPDVAAESQDLCTRLLASIGAVAWIADEAQMDAVTAVSGSGPAYVFLLAELLEQAACRAGLPPDLARLLARQTIAGSGALLAASAEDAATLRRNVTSPGGTTEAALAVLMAEPAWPSSITKAVQAATARSKELAG